MKLLNVACAGFVLAAAVALPVRGEEAAGKEELRKSLKDVEIAGTWVYDDIATGMEAARKSGKPVLVVFR